jgi:hypothetical protein
MIAIIPRTGAGLTEEFDLHASLHRTKKVLGYKKRTFIQEFYHDRK